MPKDTLLGSTGRSDSASAVSVQACAIARCDCGSVTAGFHCRVPGSAGLQLTKAMENVISSRVKSGKEAERYSGSTRIVDDPVTVHCIGDKQLLFLVVTRADYPARVVFGGGDIETAGKGLLTQLASETFDLVGVSLNQTLGGSGINVVQLPSRATQAMERVCSDFEAPASYDSVAGVQSQVDEVRGLMQTNLQSMLRNADQLSSLQEKADSTSAQAGSFARQAKHTRRTLQCEDAKMRLVLYGGGAAAGLLLLWWIFG